MWQTRDGQRLVLPASVRAAIAARLPQPARITRARRVAPEEVEAAVARSVGRLARNARYIGTVRHAASGRRLRVFVTLAPDRVYRIVARPLDRRRSAVAAVGILPRRAAAEAMVPPQPAFGPPMGLALAADRARGRGLYRLYRGRSLVYVGETEDLGRRIRQHLWCLKHLKIAPGEYVVRLAPLPRSTPRSRRVLERRLIRSHPRALRHQRS